MSDGKGWIGGADPQRVRGLVARSANVIATAHDDLDRSSAEVEHLSGKKPQRKQRKPAVTLESLRTESLRTESLRTESLGTESLRTESLASGSLETPPFEPETRIKPHSTKPISSLERRLAGTPSPAGTKHDDTEDPKKQGASAHRRAMFRHFLRSRDFGDVRSLEALTSLKDFEVMQDGLHIETNEGARDKEPGAETGAKSSWLGRLFFRKRRAVPEVRDTDEDADLPLPPARRRIIFRKLQAEKRAGRDATRAGTPAPADAEPDSGLADDDLFDRHLDAFDRRHTDPINRDNLDRGTLDDEDVDPEVRGRDAPWKGARFTHEPWQSDPEPEPDRGPSVFAAWTQRLDSLSNAIVGLLIATLLAASALGAGHRAAPAEPAAAEPVSEPEDARASQAVSPHPSQIARAETQIMPSERATDPVAALLARSGIAELEPEAAAPQTQLPSTGGFDIHAKARPQPLPSMAADVSTMLSWARPARVSAPGIGVFPYMDLPQSVPGVPQDIAGHIFMSAPRRF